MKIEKYFLEKSLALKVKELGFNEPCIMYWDNKGELKPHNPPYFYTNSVFISAPMIDQVLDWFYNTYKIHGYIERYDQGWAFCIEAKELEFFSGSTYKLCESREGTITQLIENLINRTAEHNTLSKKVNG
jgi:hypothetical protein